MSRRYLEQARLFVDRRGQQTLADIAYGRSDFQDDLPVRDADVLRGHAVRAVYLSAGATDVAVETDDADLLQALRRQWDATVARRTYITGGIGSRHQDEAFGEDFVLPADRAYSETCAGVGSIMFSWRLLLARATPAMPTSSSGRFQRDRHRAVGRRPRFFYANTLHRASSAPSPTPSSGRPGGVDPARPMVDVSCCPTNLARTFASLDAYVATGDDNGIQLHQFAPARSAPRCRTAGRWPSRSRPTTPRTG